VAAHVPLNAITQGGEFIFASVTRPVCRTRYEAAANRSGCSRSAARVSRLPKGQFAPSTRGNHMQSVPIRSSADCITNTPSRLAAR